MSSACCLLCVVLANIDYNFIYWHEEHLIVLLRSVYKIELKTRYNLIHEKEWTRSWKVDNKEKCKNKT